MRLAPASMAAMLSRLGAVQFTTFCNPFTSALSGCAPASGGGTANFLRSDGAWAPPPSAVLLATLTASNSATLAPTPGSLTGYNDYEIEFENVLPATNSVTCELQLYSNGAYQTTSYVATSYYSVSGTVTTNGTTTYLACGTGSQPNSGPGISGRLYIHNAANTTTPKNVEGVLVVNQGGTVLPSLTGGYWNGGNTAITGFQVFMSSGSVATGTIKVYGLQ